MFIPIYILSVQAHIPYVYMPLSFASNLCLRAGRFPGNDEEEDSQDLFPEIMKGSLGPWNTNSGLKFWIGYQNFLSSKEKAYRHPETSPSEAVCIMSINLVKPFGTIQGNSSVLTWPHDLTSRVRHLSTRNFLNIRSDYYSRILPLHVRRTFRYVSSWGWSMINGPFRGTMGTENLQLDPSRRQPKMEDYYSLLKKL